MNDRRRRDRRHRLIAVRFPDRRYGFPRRVPRNPLLRRYAGALAAIRHNEAVIALLASLLLALCLADLTLTQRALGAGAIEANPIMAALFESGFSVAAAAKLSLSALVVGLLWLLRRYRAALSTLIGLCAIMGGVVAYQALLLAVVD
jgi:hypothetical protein